MKRSLKRWGKRLLLAVVLSVGLSTLLFFCLPWLVIGRADTPASDVILHFALDERLNGDVYAAELLRQGKARHIVCLSSQASWQVYPADYARQHLIELGVPASQVTTFYLPAAPACRAQLMPVIADYVKRQGWRRALMVVEPTVSAANRRIASRVFARAGLQLGLTYNPRDYAVLTTNWWREHWKTQRIIGEALSTGFDFFYPECW